MTEALRLLLVCLRVGTFVFGGGLVLIPLLESDVVDANHWLTKQEFVDAVALGQMTPGPLLVTATFIGYKVALDTGWGVAGAVMLGTLATICIFLPSFIMTILASKRLGRIRDNPGVKRFLWGVRAAVVGLVVGAAISIAQSSCASWQTASVGLGALLVLLVTKVDAGLVVIASGLVGLALLSGS